MAQQFLVNDPFTPFTVNNQFKAIANGKVYVGIECGDPLNVSQQIQVYHKNGCGDYVPVSQPISTNAGGFLSYNGGASQFVVKQPFSIVVKNANNVEEWRVDKVFNLSGDDWNGFSNALLSAGNITPNGLPDTAIASQRLDAMKLLTKSDTKVTIASGLSQRSKNEDIVSSSDLLVNIESVMLGGFASKKVLVLNGGTYTSSIFHRVNDSSVIGGGATISVGGDGIPSTVSVRIGNNSTVDGVNFQCVDTDFANSRGSMELTDGASYKNCSFSGFRNPTNQNAWGLYLKDTTGALIENCKFWDNTTYDITLVDRVYGTTIRNVRKSATEGCVLAIEPNSPLVDAYTVDRTIVSSSHLYYYSQIENSSSYVMSRAVVSRSKIDELSLSGGDVTIEGCTVVTLTQHPSFMTQLKWDTLLLGVNKFIGVTPTSGGALVAPIVKFDEVDAYKFDPVSGGTVMTSYRQYSLPSLDAGRYALIVDAADVAGDNAGSLVGLKVKVGTGVSVNAKLGIGSYTVGNTYRGRVTLFFDHAGGAVIIYIGRITTGGIKTVGYLKGAGLFKVLSLNSASGNFNSIPLSPPI